MLLSFGNEDFLALLSMGKFKSLVNRLNTTYFPVGVYSDSSNINVHDIIFFGVHHKA